MPESGKKRIRTTRAVPDSSFNLEQDFSIRLKRAREQLILLREQEEQIEKERRELEGLKTQTEELEEDRRGIGAKLADAIAILETEEEDARRKQQEVADTRKEFELLIKEMKAAEKRGQKVEDVRQQIIIERGIVEKAEEAFDRARKKLEGLLEEVEEEVEEIEKARPVIDLVEGFKVGIGFFLAGTLLAAVVYIIYLMVR